MYVPGRPVGRLSVGFEVHLNIRGGRGGTASRTRLLPGFLCWILLVILAVPAVALGQSEGSPAGGATLVVDDSLGPYAAPVTEAPIEFEPAPADPVAPLPVTPVPVDSTPVSPLPETTPVEPAPVTEPGPVGEEPPPPAPVEEIPPVEELPTAPVAPVLSISPDQPDPIEIPVLQQPAPQAPQAPLAPVQILLTENLLGGPPPAPFAPAFAPPAPQAIGTVPPVAPSAPVIRAETIPAIGPVAFARSPREAVPPPRPASAEKQFSPALGALQRSMDGTPGGVASTPKPPPTPAISPPGGAPFEINPLEPTLTSPAGPAPRGSQLLGVLAQYVIAGGTGPPKSVVLLVLVTIATVAVAFSFATPRSMFMTVLGIPNKRCAGYRAVSLRPG